jgi:hypothetical protein
MRIAIVIQRRVAAAESNHAPFALFIADDFADVIIDFYNYHFEK